MSSTIKDVAKEAGVSTASVSRVVNSFPSVSPEVREKVERAMKKLRFVPDRKAKSLATGKTGSVVFLTSYETLFEDPHKFAILSGIEHSLARYKYRVYFLQVERGDLAPLRKMASQKEMDGLVVHGIEITPSLLDIVHEFAIPTLLIGEPKEKCSLSWIDNNNEVCGEVAANCLLSHGRTHFLFVGGEEADNISLSRLHGVKRALAKKGIELEERRILSLEPVAIQAEKAVRTALSSFLPGPRGATGSPGCQEEGPERSLDHYLRRLPVGPLHQAEALERLDRRPFPRPVGRAGHRRADAPSRAGERDLHRLSPLK